MKSKTIYYKKLLSFLISACFSFSACAFETATNNHSAQTYIGGSILDKSLFDTPLIARVDELTSVTIQNEHLIKDFPFVQLMHFSQQDTATITSKSSKHSQMGLFEMAMQLQDRVHYYIDAISINFSSNSAKAYEPEECQTNGFANIAKFFSF